MVVFVTRVRDREGPQGTGEDTIALGENLGARSIRAWHRRGLRQAARVLRAWQLTLLVATSAATLHAEPGEDAVRLQYAAPSECPDAAGFAAEVRARTARGRFAEPSELARTFDVRLAADAQGFSGDVEFLDDGGSFRT
jgi:hypothetical protein